MIVRWVGRQWETRITPTCVTKSETETYVRAIVEANTVAVYVEVAGG